MPPPSAKDKLPEGASTLSLGVSLDGPVNVDLSIMPHMLIGGSTGSGKTYLVLSLIQQAIMKGYQVYILDMKGGVDYPILWKGTLCSYNDSRDKNGRNILIPHCALIKSVQGDTGHAQAKMVTDRYGHSEDKNRQVLA